MAGWVTLADPADAALVAGLWPDSAVLDTPVLDVVLAVAAEACAAYAPAPDPLVIPPAPITDSARHAQILHARALAQAGAVQVTDGGLGQPYAVQTFPMDWAVKALLRPPGAPRVG